MEKIDDLLQQVADYEQTISLNQDYFDENFDEMSDEI